MSIVANVISYLKKTMRAKGITYKVISVELGLSEASVKRSFSEKSFSLKRIEEICDYLEVTLEDISQDNKYLRNLQPYISEAQEDFLSSSDEIMCIFYLIAGGKSFEWLEDNLLFSREQICKYLLQLDKVNLIKLAANNKIEVMVRQDDHWPKKGKLDETYAIQLKQEFVNSFFDNTREFEVIVSGPMSDATFYTIRNKMQELKQELRELIKLDSIYSKEPLTNTTFFSASRAWTAPFIAKYLQDKKGKLAKDSIEDY